MPLWLAGLLLFVFLSVTLGLLAWMAESWLREIRRRREVKRWETGMLERLAAPESNDAKLDHLRRLHAIVDARLKHLKGRAPSLCASLNHALYLCATQPQSVRQRTEGGALPSIDSIKALINSLEEEGGQARDREAEPTTSSRDREELPEEVGVAEEPAGKKQALLWKSLRLSTENPLVAAVIGGLLVLLIAGGIGLRRSEGSGDQESSNRDPKSRIIDQLTLHQNLVNVELDGANLRGKDLRHKNMREANLFEAKIEETDFTGANLVKADLREAELTEAVFEGAHLREARLEGAEGVGPYFEYAKAPWAKLRKVRMPGGSFVNSYFPHAYMVEAEFPNAFFQEADLREVEAARAQMLNAHLEGAHLYNADLTEANLRGAQLYEADLRSAELGFADLREADLCGADLRQSSIGTARLRDATFNGRTQWPAGFDFRAHGVVEGKC